MLDTGYWMKRGAASLSLSSIQYPASRLEIVGRPNGQPTIIEIDTL
jgi:hypothetical protein